MKQGITIQERLKDLRTERHLKLEELAAVTGISKSALGRPALPDREPEPSGHGTYGTAFE